MIRVSCDKLFEFLLPPPVDKQTDPRPTIECSKLQQAGNLEESVTHDDDAEPRTWVAGQQLGRNASTSCT